MPRSSEDSAHNMSVQSASSTTPEDISLVNSKNLQEVPSHCEGWLDVLDSESIQK
jgi:hypothetical protein